MVQITAAQSDIAGESNSYGCGQPNEVEGDILVHNRYCSAGLAEPNLLIRNVHIPHADREHEQQLFNVACLGSRVWSVTRVTETPISYTTKWQEVDGRGGLLIPSLCHAHIHLDKCFILDQCDELVTGDFCEALRVTAKAKTQFPCHPDDLYNRGHKLIRMSVECGVTSIRSHVEVDKAVQFACLDVGLKLAKEWEELCEIQIAAFAQDPLFETEYDEKPGENYALLMQAACREGVTVVGSAPYAEHSISQAKRNIDLILDLADSVQCHADFHLDYNLDHASEPLIHYVIQQMRERCWTKLSINESGFPRTVSIGHATRLGLFTPFQWHDLREAMGDLPIHIIGLPQSDMYMMGRDKVDPPRATLRVPQLAKEYGVNVAMGVNNVQNAFTPQGSVDPLSLCTLGVGLFQTSTPNDCRTLLRAVTHTSKRAIGLAEVPSSLVPRQGDSADFVILHDSQSVQQAIMSPSYDRTTIRAGRVVAGRMSTAWNSLTRNPVFQAPRWYERVRWSYLLFLPFFVWKLTKYYGQG